MLIIIKYKKIAGLIILILMILFILNIHWIGKLIYPIKYEEYIVKYSEEYDVDPLLVASIIRVESKYYKEAESHKGARGLMQIAPITGEWAAEQIGIEAYNKDLLYSPEVNIRIGCWYLNRLKIEFNNNIDLVIAAYNGGSGNVTKWLMDKTYSKDGKKLDKIPFPETEAYVEKVKKAYRRYQVIYKNKFKGIK